MTELIGTVLQVEKRVAITKIAIKLMNPSGH